MKVDPRSASIAVVLGMHRSGTSLCSNVLSLLGYDMSEEIAPHASNERGHWERHELMFLHDRVLACLDRAWDDPRHARPLPPGWWAFPQVRAIRDEIVDWLRAKHLGRHRFGFKDPRTTRLWPMWREIFATLDLQPRLIFCFRHPTAVVRSLQTRGDVLDATDGLSRWLSYNAAFVAEHGDEDICLIPYDDWFNGEDNLSRVNALLGRREPLTNEVAYALSETISASLRHHLVPEHAQHPAADHLYALLQRDARAQILSEETRFFGRHFVLFERALELSSASEAPRQQVLGPEDALGDVVDTDLGE